MNWEKKPIISEEVITISETYGIDKILASILCRRKITEPEDICFYLEDDFRFLHNPFLFKDMVSAVDRIKYAIEHKEKIFVFGDRDADGITSTSLIVESLNEYGADTSWGVPIGDDAYGLTNTIIDRNVESGIKLIITVDCGISNHKEIKQAKNHGIDTIIIDHHHSQESLPEATAIINPQMEDSGYPFTGLSGCGVALKLLFALNFSNSEYYNKTFCLLNIKPLNDAYLIETIKIKNLGQIDRINENIIPDMLSYNKCKTAEFIGSNEIIVLNKELQEKQLSNIFKDEIDINLTDIASVVKEYIPQLADKNLLMLKSMSKIAKYKKAPLCEVDILSNLFVSIILKKENLLGSNFLDKLDFVALSTLADIMPLINENRILVKQGLFALNNTKRTALRELILAKGLFGKTIYSQDIIWQLTPVINASGRMGEPHKAVELLLSKDDDEIAELLKYLLSLNNKRRKLVDKIWESTLRKARQSYEKTSEKFVFVSGRFIHRGITGILASRLIKMYKTPALVIAVLNNKAVGSLRSPKTVNIKEFLAKFSDLLSNYGGHDFAAGFTVSLDKLPAFEERFFKIADKIDLDAEQKLPAISVDAEVPTSFLEPSLFKIVEMFEPYGERNPPLVFLTKGLKVLSCDLMGKTKLVHLKMLFDSGKYKWPAILWNGVDKLGTEFDVGDTVDVLYKLNKNCYNNQETIQIMVIDMARSKG